MPLIAPDPIFKGITSSGARKSVKRILDERGDTIDRYVVPCVGQFTIPEALVNGGVDPSRIQASDITLFSSTLGYLADPTRKIDDLKFEILSEDAKELVAGFPQDNDPQKAAVIMMVMKWAQMSGEKDYIVWQRREFLHQRQQIFAKYVETMQTFAQKMGGMSYEIQDAFAVIDEAAEDEKAFIWFNPPGYSGGYEKMFDPKGHFVWPVPMIPELDPKKAGEYLDKLPAKKALVCVFATEGHALKEIPEGWLKHYTELNEKTKKRTYVLINDKLKYGVLNRRKFYKIPKKLMPVYDDHEITSESKVQLIKTDRDTALYYYDLFVRELGMVNAEVFYLFCVDGRVAGTCGFHRSEWIMKRSPILYETFGLSITCQRYARIGRLLMMAITCQEFLDEFILDVNPSLMATTITDLQTTCLTKYPEAKKNRGILKLIHREQLPNGRYHLVYKTPIHQRGYQECLDEWMKKHSTFGRK